MGVYLRPTSKLSAEAVAKMAARDKIGRASEAARAAQRNRYVQRLIEDQELRANLITAYAAARSAYGRMSNGKPATQALFEDRKLQRELKEVAHALREASGALREPPKRHRRGGLKRALLLVVVAGVLAVALSEDLRSKVLDMLFGSEEEFDYSPPASTADPFKDSSQEQTAPAPAG
jgi:uncharacterized membrane protein YccC